MQRLKGAYSLPAKPDRYCNRGKSLSAQYVQHALEQARFLVSCRRSAGARAHIEFLYPDQINARYAPKILKRDTLPSVVSTVYLRTSPTFAFTPPIGENGRDRTFA